ncbi:MAG: SpoIID/LytB domain-containing protein [Chitinispirillaceae bacterium]|nr:SpoIID/LytB domain-containing protein [Chitinispirillaceae bacterium]
MTTKSSFFSGVAISLLACVFFSCTSLSLLTPNPPEHGGKPSVARAKKKKSQQKRSAERQESAQEKELDTKGDDVDFSLAFANEEPDSSEPKPPVPRVLETKAQKTSASEKKPIKAPSSKIRVLLRRSIINATLYAMGPYEIRSPSLVEPVSVRGRITFEMRSGSRLSLSLAEAETHEVGLPCTLWSQSPSSLMNVGNDSYRGSMIIAGGSRLMLINHLDMEDYLRGVLPLEMGKVQTEEIEALKAQAVASRTYAYKRMVDREPHPYDVVCTVADQIYGGANAETSEADVAIAATRRLVLSWHDSLAQVYFHSTCGGMTANINDVWDRPFFEYLSAVSDLDSDGTPYCSISRLFSWEQSWSGALLSTIIRANAKKGCYGKRLTGQLESIEINDRFDCGRIRSCTFQGSGGSIVCGGDKIRFLLRRKSPSGNILRSANFTVVKNGPHHFTVKGIGYGHGVGLCQMGAIGRARQGQTFEQILQAYFGGTDISAIEVR